MFLWVFTLLRYVYKQSGWGVGEKFFYMNTKSITLISNIENNIKYLFGTLSLRSSVVTCWRNKRRYSRKNVELPIVSQQFLYIFRLWRVARFVKYSWETSITVQFKLKFLLIAYVASLKCVDLRCANNGADAVLTGSVMNHRNIVTFQQIKLINLKALKFRNLCWKIKLKIFKKIPEILS